MFSSTINFFSIKLTDFDLLLLPAATNGGSASVHAGILLECILVLNLNFKFLVVHVQHLYITFSQKK